MLTYKEAVVREIDFLDLPFVVVRKDNEVVARFSAKDVRSWWTEEVEE